MAAGLQHGSSPSCRGAFKATQLTLALALACGVYACTDREPAAPVSSAPRVAFDQTLHDFGVVEQGTRVTHTYRFRNAGGLDLTIDNVRTSCGCTAAVTASRVVASGNAGAVVVECDTTDAVGSQNKTITVYSNDPAQPVTTLTLSGGVRADVAAAPPRLYIGHLGRGQTAANAVRIVGDVTVVSVEAEGARIEPVLSDGGRQLQVVVKKDAPLGSFEEIVTVRTSSNRRPLLRVPVVGVVDGDVTVSPGQLDFGVTAPNATASRAVGVQHGGKFPVHIVAVRLTPAVGTAVITTNRDGRGYRVTVTLSAGLRRGKFSGTLEVETDHPEQSHLQIPFSGQVVEKS